jgi:glutathione synthase
MSVLYIRMLVQDDYPSESEWAVRLLIERSRAIKCPSIAYHLAGAKKVQQVLADPGQLQCFLDNEEAQQVQRVFAGLFSLSDDEGPPGRTAQVILCASAHGRK